VREHLVPLIEEQAVDLVVVNAEMPPAALV